MSKAIIAGSNSALLAKSIANLNDLELLSPRVVHFINAEMKVTIPENTTSFEEVFLVQSTSNPANDNLMEICLLADTVRRDGVGKIQALIPYFGYARQDKQHLPHECVSIDVIARILQCVGVDKIITVDIHNEKSLTNIDFPIENVSAIPLLAERIYKDLGLDENSEKDYTIASPDYGGINRSQDFAKHFYKNQANSEIVSIKKKRHLDKMHYCEAVELNGNIKDKKVILIDDVSTSGSTLLNAMELCKANGVKEVYGLVVHADFAKGVAEKLQNSNFSKIYTTNSIEKTVENLEFYDKIQVEDIAQMFKC